MDRNLSVVCVLLLSLNLLVASCNGSSMGITQNATFDQLLVRPTQFNGRTVSVEGFYFHGFEVIVLCERLDYSGYASGHLIPVGEKIWIEGSIPPDVYDNLYQQEMMDPIEYFGKIRITGKFEHGGKYGHLDAYTCQIIPDKVKLLPWSPPR